MASLGVNRSNSATSISSVSAPKVSAPAHAAASPSTTSAAPKPSAFKSSTAEAPDNKQEVNQVMQASCLDMRRNAQLMDTQVNNAIMSDLSASSARPVAASGPAPVSATQAQNPEATGSLANMAASRQPTNLTDAMGALQNGFRSTETEVPVGKDGNLSAAAKGTDTFMMRYNPHASKAAKKESEMFRAFAEKEFSKENPGFLDATYQLSKTSPDKPDFDKKLGQLYENYVGKGADGKTPEKEINISNANRGHSAAAYKAWNSAKAADEKSSTPETKAGLEQARTEMVNAMAANAKEIRGLMNDTFSRYGSDNFRKDVLNNRNMNIYDKIRIAHQVDQQYAARDKAKGTVTPEATVNKAINSRFKQARENGKLYDSYKKNLKDPQWEDKLKAREARIEKKEKAWGANRGSFKYEIKNFFMMKYN